VVIGAIDEQHINRRALQSLSCSKAAKAAANNYHERSFRRHLFVLNLLQVLDNVSVRNA
jgi:hypothetical protein